MDQAFINVKIDIGEAARRVLIEYHRQRMADLEEINRAVAKASLNLDQFMRELGPLDEVKPVSSSSETAVQK